jgi:flagellar L-ring protein precursor FlgH
VQTFTSSMTAIVTSVLPSGAMLVAGDQKLTINGVPQALHVTGIIRGEDIDSTDSVLSSLVADIDAKFSGIDTQERNKGILQKIIGFLFG